MTILTSISRCKCGQSHPTWAKYDGRAYSNNAINFYIEIYGILLAVRELINDR